MDKKACLTRGKVIIIFSYLDKTIQLERKVKKKDIASLKVVLTRKTIKIISL